MTDREQIEHQIERFITAYNTADLATLMSIYTDDVIKCRNESPSETRAETEARIRKVLQDYRGVLCVTNDEITVSTEMAFVRGVLELKLTHRHSGESRDVRRRFLEIWRPENGSWRVCRTMDNLDTASN
jgi:ketosteroid isomerase-like protein